MAQTDESSRRSCTECHRRKIKCDKSFPSCSYCVKVRIECRYPPPKRPPEKGFARGDTINLNVDVISRINKIECTLESFERTLSQISQLVLPILSEPSQLINHGGADVQRQQHDQGTDRSTQCDVPTSPLNRTSSTNPINPPTSIDMSFNTKHTSCATSTTIISLWQTFLERVDPVLKIIHVPTIQQKIMDVVTGRVSASVEFKTLIDAICYSAVITMSVEECQRFHNKEREEFLSGYRDTVGKSLASAMHLTSTDMIPLQAFVLCIICGRSDKSLKGTDVMDLLSVAINTARKNGLHKIDSYSDSDSILPPFETEMRRRIWWQLYTLDVRNAEDNGLDPYIQEHWANTLPRLPRSINDISLHPEMRRIPQSSLERTEMLFTLDRHEISTLVRRILFSDEFCQQNFYPILSVAEKCDEIERFRTKIEDQILSLCNLDIPIDYITATSSRLVFAKLKLSVTKPTTRENQHVITQESFRRTCVDILKSTRELRLYENGKQWLWLFQTYLEWDALAYLFINLSLVPSGDTVNCAWIAAEDIYQYWKGHGEVVLDNRWRQIENLRSQALLGKQMYQENPASFPPWPRSSCEERPDTVQPNEQGLPSTVLVSNILEPNPNADALDVPVPTTGTECQWSTALFDRYFQVLDMDHNMELSWL